MTAQNAGSAKDACLLCMKVQEATRTGPDVCRIVTAKTLVRENGFSEEDARIGMLAFKNCLEYPQGCPKEGV